MKVTDLIKTHVLASVKSECPVLKKLGILFRFDEVRPSDLGSIAEGFEDAKAYRGTYKVTGKVSFKRILDLVNAAGVRRKFSDWKLVDGALTSTGSIGDYNHTAVSYMLILEATYITIFITNGDMQFPNH